MRDKRRIRFVVKRRRCVCGKRRFRGVVTICRVVRNAGQNWTNGHIKSGFKTKYGKNVVEMSSSQWAVLDTDDNLEFKADQRYDAFRVYNEYIERINSELSKLILGQTEQPTKKHTLVRQTYTPTFYPRTQPR